MHLYMSYLYACMHDDKLGRKKKTISKDPAKGRPKYNLRD